MNYGKLWGIGVGPGDPELLTLKAKRVLEQLDILLVPHSRLETRSLALSIIRDSLDKDWQTIELVLPMTRERTELQQHWRQAALTVKETLAGGQDAAFITLGDPTLYSTFTYLLKEVRGLVPGLETEIIPGVSSVTAITAWLQQPLAENQESLLIMPAQEKFTYLENHLQEFDNVMIMKAGRYTGRISELLDRQPARYQAFLASRCGFADELFTDDLSSLQGQDIDYLSSVLIKKISEGETR